MAAPVYLNRESNFFLSFAAPGIKVPEHSHDEGDGIRVILSGSLTYGGHQLTAGDWMLSRADQNTALR